MRIVGFMSLAGVAAAGLVSLICVLQGWWAVSILFIFVALLIVTALILLSVRSINRQLLTEAKESRIDAKKFVYLLQKCDEKLEAITLAQQHIRDQQEDSLVVVESSIDNLRTRIQQILDTDDKLPKSQGS